MGARCIAGGKRVWRSFYEPTIKMVNVTPEMPVMKDEVFGPVAPVCSFKDADEAVAMAQRVAGTDSRPACSRKISTTRCGSPPARCGRRRNQWFRSLPTG